MHAVRAFLACTLVLLFTGCASLPSQDQRTETRALTNTADTGLGKAVRGETSQHPGKSGIHALPVANEAFAARILLAESAQRTLDLQYYIWHRDTTGELLWEAVWAAAERGVRVRALIDDANTKGLDPMLATLDTHPNIEIRLFNPFASRKFRASGFITDFTRLNHRMHNKSFTADNQVSIVGGRNIGDEYFGANMEVGFQDLDVMAIGPVVQEVSDEFDLFWNSASAYPAANMLPTAPSDGVAQLRAGWSAVHDKPDAKNYVAATRQTPLVQQVAQRKVPFEWTTAKVLHDDPAKALSSSDRKDLQMLPRLEQALGKPETELDLVSPYFVPGKEGTAGLVTLAKRGVKVRVLTNSLSATDVAPVHAGYAKYRKELLEAGITVYELKPGAAVPSLKEDDRSGGGLPGSGSGSGGGSAASLHAKTFASDRKRIFVGSFNLDPRSARLNTEMGVVIDSPVIANGLATQLDKRLSNEAYLVRLKPDGSIEWVEGSATGDKVFATEPGSSGMRRLWVDFLGVLPIEWML
ncbi:phospholipase D family protein [Variovorax sp. J22R133]|uniref:phospholipase D family protein n=1 Tax=Variovorax brevis TaxID=3053503 RepID=UPI00257661F0|nr:phospholipase D family protein [Variovorax sp. J22R133]MDM0113624.1 phospholipase D family protein [Variovorax sp. J22R133]